MKTIYISLIIATLLIGIVGAGVSTLVSKDKIVPDMTTADKNALKDCGYSMNYKITEEFSVKDNNQAFLVLYSDKAKDVDGKAKIVRKEIMIWTDAKGGADEALKTATQLTLKKVITQCTNAKENTEIEINKHQIPIGDLDLDNPKVK